MMINFIVLTEIKGDTHMTSTLGVIGSKGWGRGVSRFSGCPIFTFFIKENWICAMTRHHGEPQEICHEK